jgi:NADPH:quinone reductase
VGHIAVQVAGAFGAEVFARVSLEKKDIVEGFGASAIDYRSISVAEYVATYTGEKGFDIIFDTVGGATLDDSFSAVKLYTWHVVSALGWGTHSLAPLSLRGATYSGVFTLLPLITRENRSHHGHILTQCASLVEAGKLRPLVSAQRFSTSEIEAAHALVESGSIGKVVVEIE